MIPTATADYNRYRNSNHVVNIHQGQKCNPLADLTLPNNCTTMHPQRMQAKASQPKLTNEINREIITNLKNKEKEFVGEMNYYANINRYGLPQDVNAGLTETLGRNRSRFIRGESYAQENGILGADFAQTKAPKPKKKEDFLDRFIQRQNNRQGYYKNADKLETLKCDKYPDFLTNSEFIPNNKENNCDFDEGAFNGMKKSKMLPNSMLVDRNVHEIQVEKEWSRNYSNVLNNQKVLKDVNYMDLGKYNSLSKKITGPYVHAEQNEMKVDPVLKDTIMDIYNQI